MATPADPDREVPAVRSNADLVAGLVFIAFGLAFAGGALQHELGSLLQMGPGYFPLALAVILLGLGLAVVAKAYLAPDLAEPAAAAGDEGAAAGSGAGEPLAFERIEWRPVAAIAVALLFFAFTVEGLGLLPATFGTAVVASYAARETSARRALVIAAALTLTSYVIFVVLLQVRLTLVGEWLGG